MWISCSSYVGDRPTHYLARLADQRAAGVVCVCSHSLPTAPRLRTCQRLHECWWFTFSGCATGTSALVQVLYIPVFRSGMKKRQAWQETQQSLYHLSRNFQWFLNLWFLKAEFCVAIFYINLSGIVSKPYHTTFFFLFTHTHTHIYITFTYFLSLCVF